MKLLYCCALATFASCVQPNLTTCENGIVGAAEQICHPRGCVDEVQRTACDSLAPGAPCETPTFTGLCSEGAFIAPRCGDGIVEGEEECEVSTNFAECSSECVLLACGNGRLEADEECDDGNLRSNDNCSSRCTTEAVQWTVEPISPGTENRLFAYDRERQRLVYSSKGLTMEWSSVDKRWVSASVREFAGQAASIVPDPEILFFDAVTRKVNMIAMVNNSAELWQWDGTQWAARQASGAKPARALVNGNTPTAAAVFHTQQGKLFLLFPSASVNSSVAWTLDSASNTWSGSTLLDLAFNAAQSDRDVGLAVAYDDVAKRIVIVNRQQNSTLAWDGTSPPTLLATAPGNARGTSLTVAAGGALYAIGGNGDEAVYRLVAKPFSRF